MQAVEKRSTIGIYNIKKLRSAIVQRVSKNINTHGKIHTLVVEALFVTTSSVIMVSKLHLKGQKVHDTIFEVSGGSIIVPQCKQKGHESFADMIERA